MKKSTKKYETNVFKMLRLCNDLKIPEVSEAVGISQQYVRDIENGHRYPSQEKLEKYCKVLNVSVDTFHDIEDIINRNKNEESLTTYQKIMFFVLTKLVKL